MGGGDRILKEDDEREPGASINGQLCRRKENLNIRVTVG